MAASLVRGAGLALAALTLGSVSVAAQTVMQPGAWQMHVSVSVRNPQTGETLKPQETKTVVCFTPEFLAKQPYFTPALDEQRMTSRGAKCSTSDFARNGNAASWKLSCTTAEGRRVDMTISNTAEARKLTSEMRQLVSDGGQATPVDMVMTGTFVGECTGDMIRP